MILWFKNSTFKTVVYFYFSGKNTAILINDFRRFKNTVPRLISGSVSHEEGWVWYSGWRKVSGVVPATCYCLCSAVSVPGELAVVGSVALACRSEWPPLLPSPSFSFPDSILSFLPSFPPPSFSRSSTKSTAEAAKPSQAEQPVSLVWVCK